MAKSIDKKSIKKYSYANSSFLVPAIAIGLGLFSSLPLQAMAPKMYKKRSAHQKLVPSVDQFSLVVRMGIWDQALTILENAKTKKIKKSYLLGDYAHDDEQESNLHLASLRAPIEYLRKFVKHAQRCNIDLPNLFFYTQNEDGRPLRLTVLDLAYYREYDRDRAIAYLKEEAFPKEL